MPRALAARLSDALGEKGDDDVMDDTGSLTELETDILDELCQTRVTASSVVLTDSLQARDRWKGWLRLGDGYAIVAWIVSSLNDKGMVTYALRRAYGEVPVNIRVTRRGYELAGYEYPVRLVGSRQRSFDAKDPARHPGDLTDFRNLIGMTWGGEIERASLADHVAAYPEHAAIHQAQLAEQKGETDMARRATDLTEPLVQGADADVVEDTAMQMIGASVKHSILRLVVERGGIKDATTIPEALAYQGRPGLDTHTTDHLLWSLQKEGLVTFRERRDGKIRYLTDVTATDQGQSRVRDLSAPKVATTPLPGDAGLRDPYRAKGSGGNLNGTPRVAPGGPVEIVASARGTSEAGPKPDDETLTTPEPEQVTRWPVLEGLRERARRDAETHVKVDALRRAATAMDQIDPTAAELLRYRADEVDTTEPFSDVEHEYLAFATATERGESKGDD